MHGSERAMHLGAWAVRRAGHKIFLLHGMAGASETATRYDGELCLPVIFDRSSKLSPAGLSEAEAQVSNFCDAHQVDLIHIHGYPRTETLTRLAGSRTVVVTVHVPLCPNGARYLWRERQACSRDIGLGCFTTGFVRKGCGRLGNQEPQSLPGFLRGMAEDHLLRQAIMRCKRVVTPSEWLRQRLIQDGIPAEITHTLAVTVSEDDVPDATSRRPAPDEPPIVAFVGRLVDFKGPDHLLKASVRIVPPHRIWFIGDGPMRPKLERMTDEMGLRDHTTFFGSMPPEQVAHYRSQCAVVVVPSLWQEVFGMVGPEAMLLGIPVIAYRVGGIPEWLQDGVTGLLVDPGSVEGLADATSRILEDTSFAQVLGENGRQATEAWQPEKHAEKLLAIYQEVAICD